MLEGLIVNRWSAAEYLHSVLTFFIPDERLRFLAISIEPLAKKMKHRKLKANR